MLGYLQLVDQKGRRPTLDETEILGLRLLRASVPVLPGLRQERIDRRIAKAAALLADEGVRRVLTQENFSRWAILKMRGLKRVDTWPLCQAMAAPLALAALKKQRFSPEQSVVALRGNRVNRAFYQAALELCAHVRALIIEAPSGGPALAKYLHEEYGVPILEGGRAELAVNFSPGSFEKTAQTLCLFDPEPILSGLNILLPGRELPGSFETLPLLSALWETGKIDLSDLVAESGDKTQSMPGREKST